MVAIRLLGPVEADVSGEPADLGGPRQRAVLALLLVARGEVVSVDRLIDDLWRGEPPPRAIGALQAYVSHLRRALEPDRSPRTPARILVSAPPGYRIVLPAEAVDAWHFDALVTAAAAHEGDAATELPLLQQALGLWRGPALGRFAGEPWAAPEAARLDELRLLARERLAAARIGCGAYAEAVLDAEALVREAPLRERGWQLLATGQYASGRQGDALATLRRARDLLAEELGVDPGPQLAELEQAVLRQTLRLAPPPLPNKRPVVQVPGPPPSSADAGPPGSTTFVGREAELSDLRAAADAARAGTPAIALVSGEAGSGKSALLSQLRAQLAAGGWRTAAGRCPEAEGGSPAWAWAEVLRTLAADVDPGPFAAELAPLLGDASSGDVPDALHRRFRLHRATARWLSTLDDRPLLIVIDDLHRADAATRALLTSLLDQHLAGRVLVVAAYRPEVGEGLDEVLARLARHSPTRVRLAGLGEADATALIAAVIGSAPDPAVAAVLTRRTDGNPFYLVESARLLASEGEVVAISKVPEGVSDVLRRRFARLPEETVSVLRLAAVIGRDVDVALLTRAAELDEDAVLDALEAGVISGLLVEPSQTVVRFSHLLVRETLYAGIPRLRRVRWHARVADAVAELYPSDLSALAHHAVQAAGPATAARAAQHAVAAACLAESRFAWDAAAELYGQALTCLDLDASGGPHERIDIQARLVQALIYSGATVAARQVRSQALEVALASGDDDLVVRAATCWNVPTPWQTRTYQTIDAPLVDAVERQLARADLPTDDRIRLLCLLVREVSSTDDPRSASSAEQALRLAREHGDAQLHALALLARAEVLYPDLEPERREQVRSELEQLVTGRSDMVVYAVLVNVWTVQREMLRLDLAGARARLDAASTLARQYQLTQAQVVVTMIEALLAHLSGDLEGAERLYTEAYRTNKRSGAVNADGIWVLALATVAFSAGRLRALEPQLRQLYAGYGSAGGDALALALLERGAVGEARTVLRGQAPIPRDFFWTMFTTARALVAAGVRDRDLARQLYPQLLPYADQIAGAGTAAFGLGPVALALGRLAVVLGDHSAARTHLAGALAIARRCGNAAWTALVQRDLDALPAPCGSDTDPSVRARGVGDKRHS